MWPNVLMVTITQQVFYHVVGRPFLRRLVFPCLVVLLFVVLADAIVDWNALRQQIMLLTPVDKTIAFVGLFLLWGLVAGRALAPIWHQPMIGFLLRQPLTRWHWVAGLSPSLGIAFLPIFPLWWLAPNYGNSVIHYLGFVGLLWPIILGASYKTPSSVIVMGAGITTLAILVFSYSYYPFAAYFAFLVTILQLPVGVALIRKQLVRANKQGAGHLSSAGVVPALVRRDLRCLRRVESNSLLNILSLTVITVLMMLALRVNGAIEGREAFLAGCVLFSLVASATYPILEKLMVRLGKEFMRHRWPVTYSQRGLALIGLVTVLSGIGGILIGFLGASMGGYYLLLLFLFSTVTITLCVALFSRSLGAITDSTALCLLLITFHNVAVFLLPAWAYAILAVPTSVINFRLTTSGIQRFAVNIERTSLDQLA